MKTLPFSLSILLFLLLPLQSLLSIPFISIKNKETKEEMPNPLNLSTHWWSYFEKTPEELEERIERFSAYLEKRTEQLPKEGKAAKEIEEIISHLRLYAALKKLEVEEPPIATFAKEYGIDQLATIVETIFKLREKIESEKRNSTFLRNRMDAIEERMDKKILAYRKSDPNTRERFTLGLEIISMRAAYAVNGEKLRLSEEWLKNSSLTLDRWNDEKAYAMNHLKVDAPSLQESKNSIDRAAADYRKAEELSLDVELTAIESIKGDKPDKANLALHHHGAIAAYIDEALAYAKLTYLQAKLLLYRLISDPSSVDMNDAESSVDEWKSAIALIRDYIEVWEAANKNAIANLQRMDDSSPDDQEQLKSLKSTLNGISSLKVALLQLDLLLEIIEREIGKHIQAISSWIIELSRKIYSCCIPSPSLINMTLFKVDGLPVTLANLVQAIIAFIGTLLLSKLIRYGLKKALRRKKVVSRASMFILDRIIHYLLIVAGTIISLTIMGLDFSNVMLLIGALSVGIGFGLQSIVNNFVSSLILLFSRSVKLGDFIQIPSGEWGRVVDVNIQNTIITTSDGVEIIEPNSNLIANKFVNWTMNNPYRRIRIPFYVEYNSDKELLKKVVVDCAKNVYHTVTNNQYVKPPTVWLVGLEQGYMKYELVVWISSKKSPGNQGVVADYYWEIERVLKSHHFSVPLPKRDLYIKESRPTNRE